MTPYQWLVYHDRLGKNQTGGQSYTDFYKSRGASFPAARPAGSPYTWEVADGKIYQHYGPDVPGISDFPGGYQDMRQPGAANKTGAHAYRANPKALGLAWGGRVGQTPPESDLNALRYASEKIKSAYPDIQGRTHGALYSETKGTPLQASKSGRSMDEGAWYKKFDQPEATPAPGQVRSRDFASSPRAPGQPIGVAAGSVAPGQPPPTTGGAPINPVANRSLVNYAGLPTGGGAPKSAPMVPPAAAAPLQTAGVAPQSASVTPPAGAPSRLGSFSPPQANVAGLPAATSAPELASASPVNAPNGLQSSPNSVQSPGANPLQSGMGGSPGVNPVQAPKVNPVQSSPTAIADAGGGGFGDFAGGLGAALGGIGKALEGNKPAPVQMTEYKSPPNQTGIMGMQEKPAMSFMDTGGSKGGQLSPEQLMRMQMMQMMRA